MPLQFKYYETMSYNEKGFSLIELIAVMVILGVISITATSRFSDGKAANVQAGRDDLIAALFFAQQTAMARNNIQLTVSAGGVDVTENGNAIILHKDAYPLLFPAGVTATPVTFIYDKLGRVNTADAVTLSASGNSATVNVDGSGYAYY